KTQIALEYLYRCGSESDCDIYWVHGSGLPTFSDEFRAIAQHGRIPLAGTETDEEGFLLNVKRWFQGPDSGHWILVIDNADNEEDFIGNSGRISKFVPQGPRGTLIFTTRSLQVALRQGCERIEIGKMEDDEAQALFLKHLVHYHIPSDKEQQAINMILNSIHRIPLAIIGAAAFMTETQIPPSTYWTIFRGSDEQAKRLLSRPFCDIRREADMTQSILATYFITFDLITRQMPLAADLLRLIASLDRQNIPEELLSQSGLDGIDDQIQFLEAIGKLLGFSLVTRVECEDQKLYELHRLVQLSLQVYLPTEELSRWRATALKVVSRLFPRRWATWRDVSSVYIPHVLVVTENSTDPIAEELCFRLGLYFRDMGKYDESEKMHRHALEGREKILGPDHPDTLTSVNNLALVLREQGKYGESEKMHRHALEGREKILGPDHPNTLTSVNNLALVLHGQGKYDKSEKMHRRALEGREKI
ncbi:unnamed protein product, partial [Tuber aestivum]